jgi:hypothetical protein
MCPLGVVASGSRYFIAIFGPGSSTFVEQARLRAFVGNQ